MTNAHYHRGDATLISVRGIEHRFWGVHPWAAEGVPVADVVDRVREAVLADAAAGVGEIGLDRLRTRTVTPAQRQLFDAQLRVAAELRRPVVLHGAKCWGDVVKTIRPFVPAIPSFLFHGFSRSGGLIPEIVELNGFVSVGKAVLNDHAVNYRKLVAQIPRDRLLVETDDDAEPAARDSLLAAIWAKTAELTGITEAELDANAEAFLRTLDTP